MASIFAIGSGAAIGAGSGADAAGAFGDAWPFFSGFFPRFFCFGAAGYPDSGVRRVVTCDLEAIRRVRPRIGYRACVGSG